MKRLMIFILLTSLLVFSSMPAFAGNYDSTIVSTACKIHDSWNSMKNTVIVVDFTKPMTANRLFVVDVSKKKIVLRTRVCHGIGSGSTNVPTKFSNGVGTKASCLGVMITAGTYYGTYGYSMKVVGLQPGVNDRAETRRIIFHNSDLQSTAWSWGCFSVPGEVCKTLIDMTKDGSLIYAFGK